MHLQRASLLISIALTQVIIEFWVKTFVKRAKVLFILLTLNGEFKWLQVFASAESSNNKKGTNQMDSTWHGLNKHTKLTVFAVLLLLFCINSRLPIRRIQCPLNWCHFRALRKRSEDSAQQQQRQKKEPSQFNLYNIFILNKQRTN